MYGMVNRAIMDLVLANWDQATWETICDRAGLTSTKFANTTVYDDAVTYSLVSAASEVLDLDTEAVLENFGRHWILYTGREGWGPLFDMAGDDLRTFVEGLDAMHARVQASMPDCRMPSFSVVADPDGPLEVGYRSEREGLGAMVGGLLAGLAEHFDERWDIERTGTVDNEGSEVFKLRPSPAG